MLPSIRLPRAHACFDGSCRAHVPVGVHLRRSEHIESLGRCNEKEKNHSRRIPQDSRRGHVDHGCSVNYKACSVLLFVHSETEKDTVEGGKVETKIHTRNYGIQVWASTEKRQSSVTFFSVLSAASPVSKSAPDSHENQSVERADHCQRERNRRRKGGVRRGNQSKQTRRRRRRRRKDIHKRESFFLGISSLSNDRGKRTSLHRERERRVHLPNLHRSFRSKQLSSTTGQGEQEAVEQ